MGDRPKAIYWYGLSRVVVGNCNEWTKLMLINESVEP